MLKILKKEVARLKCFIPKMNFKIHAHNLRLLKQSSSVKTTKHKMATIVARTIAQRNICSQRFLLFTATRNSQIESGRSKEKSVVHSSPLGEGDLNLISGIPIEQTEERKATVYLPSRNAMQSGTHNMRRWTVSFDTESRWENPLMGWASTADPLSNTQLKFNTREAAVEYCKAYGWNFEVVEPTLPKMKPKSYGANFSWNKRTRVSTK